MLAEIHDGAQVCINGDQLAAVFAFCNRPALPHRLAASALCPPHPDNTIDASTTSPIIQINGDNPAVIQAGDSYTDLGATITGPQADLNLGITTYVNGMETSPVQIDTSTAATDTIDYVATDQNGLTLNLVPHRHY